VPSRPQRIRDLAASLLDGDSVDWGSAESTADEAGRRLIRQLRVVAGIARVHQSPSGESEAGRRPPAGSVRGTPGPGTEWGPLRVIERIGAGAFGEVYRAWDTRLDREVAVKLLRAPEADGSTPSSVIEEGRLLARVRHPNVVSVYGAERFEGRLGIWMELVRGKTLAEIVADEGVFGADEAALIGMTVCKALSAIHRAGLRHRDIKAQNVMREDGGRIVLMDFGTGEIVEDPPPAHRALTGTPLYLAPEVLAGEASSARSEIYSVGVLLHLLVTGTFPVAAKTMTELRAAHASPGRRRLRHLRSDLPEAFARVVERALAPDPAARFESAGEMERALLGLFDTAPAPATKGTGGTTVAPRWLLPILFAAIVALTVLGRAAWQTGGMARDGPPARVMLGVLPFQYLSGDPAEHEFSRGLMEEVISHLGSQNPTRLGVLARPAYERGRQTAAQVGRELHVQYLLDGSVQKWGDRVRITAQLIETHDQTRVWEATFEQDLREVLALQRGVAEAIAGAIVVQVAPGPDLQRRLSGSRPVDPRTYQLYLMGRFLRGRGTELEKARSYFEQAIARDPFFGPAHAGLADLTLTTSYADAEEAAREAVRLDDGLVEAHAALAHALMHQFAWSEARVEFQRALDLDESYPPAWRYYAELMTAGGRFADALRLSERARVEDPLVAVGHHAAGVVLYFARHYDRASEQFRKALELDPGLVASRIRLAQAYVELRQYDRAISELSDASAGGTATTLASSHAYAAAGRSAEARVLLSREAGQDGPAQAYDRAAVYAALGDHDSAFRNLERAVEGRAHDVIYLEVDPRLDPLRADQRFNHLVRPWARGRQ
jgi:serine/threonine-protein kinase